MASSDSGKPKRERRSSRVVHELERLRRRNAEQLAQARERERRVDEALREYATASARIEAAAHAHDEKVRRLHERIAAATAAHEAAVEQDVLTQARAVASIQDCGRTVRELAVLLAVSQRAVSRLLDRARDDGDDRGAAASEAAGLADAPGAARALSSLPDEDGDGGMPIAAGLDRGPDDATGSAIGDPASPPTWPAPHMPK